ncbi:uncharacterized protein PG998_014194 [Apiospora kogelbergensis]|uniref:uncharacterized protein n=1 Tax=Apiospora kogelbergensis TaxID=1337665 RepID=UPI0031321A80
MATIATMGNISRAQEDSDSSLEQILGHIQWAADAKWIYSRFIEAAFRAQNLSVPAWVLNIYKLGRYGVASKVLPNFAVGSRSFCPMKVEALVAPPKQRHTLLTEDNNPEATLRRSIGDKPEEAMMRLGRHWNASEPEKRFCKNSRCDLTVHAELQLINFYDHNPDKMPRTRFIGVSKKSCFLCYKFLQRHSLNFGVSACHQKLYPNWIPPPYSSSKIYKQYKKMINELSGTLEVAAKHEIEQRLGLGTRRPLPLDSTTGVSLPQALSQQVVDQYIEQPYERLSSPTSDDLGQGSASQREITPDSIIDSTDEYGGARLHDATSSPSARQDYTSTGAHETATRVMIFHVKWAEDSARQDLIALPDIISPTTGKPCWDLMCVILATEQGFSVGFDKDSEFLLVNGNLRVGNGRQFNACLEYLRNAQSWNNEALVCLYAGAL